MNTVANSDEDEKTEGLKAVETNKGREKIVLSGATGFIGSHIAKAFCSAGIAPVCLVRDRLRAAYLEELGCTLHIGDVCEPDSLCGLFEDTSLFIHNAAKVDDWGTYEDFHAVNVKGTENVLLAAEKAGVKNIILTGSISAYGEESFAGIKDEESPFSPHYKYFLGNIFPCAMNFYRETKTDAVVLAQEFCQKAGINLTVIEPAWVYGEREFSSGFFEYLKTVESGLSFMPGSRKNVFHSVYAGDLAGAYLAAWQKRLQGIHRFIIGEKNPHTMDQLYTALCEFAGYRKPINLPKWIMYPPAFLMELFASVFKAKKAPILTRGRVNMFYDNIEYSAKKAEARLNYTSSYSFEETIARTVQWYIDTGFLKKGRWKK